jgi:two-component system, NtrC family, response regulator AtoC
MTALALAQLLGESPAIARLKEQVGRLILRQAEGARRHAPILILGETGTGKGLLAGAIHRAGPRAAGPFIDVNCAAIPSSLVEAELFGFERGAFTDARQSKAGLFQAAHRGTLFLDEIGLLPEGSQAKLLKALEEQSVRRLGSTRSEPVDVWLIAATSENLDAAVQTRRFREDLYHRLAVVTLRLPPLRERGDDILHLAEHFLSRACEDYGLARRTLSAEARAALQVYAWPGNVRELANVIERVALLSDGITVTAATLALPSPRARLGALPGGAAERQAVVEAESEAERSRVLETLRVVKWNISQAAVRLGMPRNTLRYRMEKLGLGSDSKAGPSATPPATPAGVRWEPRRVTFVRARLVALGAEPTSPEISRTMEMIVDKVESFGGHVEERGAKSLVAAFGLESIENAALHAASAALAIQKVTTRVSAEDSPRPAVTLAIHTTRVLVGRHPRGDDIDTDAKRLALAVLDALEERAEPGAIAVSADAAPFLARRFEVMEGRLVGPLAPERRFKTGFVGRESELGLLRERLHQAEAGHGQIVSIVGEPGMGKTRLLGEFRRQAAGDAMWMEGQAIAFGGTIPFHPMIDLVRRAFQIEEGDPESVVAEKIEHAVLRLGEDLRPSSRFSDTSCPSSRAIRRFCN